MQDLAKIKRWYQQTQFTSEQLVNVIQNVSQERTDKKITIMDLVNAGRLAYLTIFPGNTLIPVRQYYAPFGYHAFYGLFYVKGLGNNKASVIWGAAFACDGGNASTKGMWTRTSTSDFEEVLRFDSNFLVNVSPERIHPKLTIKEGEIKVIAECLLICYNHLYFADGTRVSSKSFREIFGLMAFGLTHRHYNSPYFHAFFNSTSIFTPKPGLFDETPPK